MLEGEIFLARLKGAAGFEKYVVIKSLRRHLDGDERSVKAFLEEARIVAGISHPNVCQVYELCIQDGHYYLAMEYLEGQDLQSRLRAGESMTLDRRELRKLTGASFYEERLLFLLIRLPWPEAGIVAACHFGLWLAVVIGHQLQIAVAGAGG